MMKLQDRKDESNVNGLCGNKIINYTYIEGWNQEKISELQKKKLSLNIQALYI